jgi:hypothetical protein
VADKTLKFEIAVGTDGMIQGLKVATKAVDDTTQSIKFGMGKGKDAVEGITNSLQKFKTEQTQQARTARYFAQELADIIPGADGAKTALQSLISIGLGVGGVAVAFDIVATGLRALSDHLEENDKRAREMRKAFRDAASTAADAMDGVERALHPQTKTQAAWSDAVKQTRNEIRELQAQMEETSTGWGAKVRNVLHGMTTNAAGKSDAFTIKGTDELIKPLEDQIKAKIAGLASQRPNRDKVEADERKKQAEATTRELAALEAGLADEITKINVDKKNRIEELEKDHTEIYAPERARRVEGIERESAEKIRRLREDHLNSIQALEREAAAANGSETERIQAATETKLQDLRTKLSRTRDTQEQQLIRRQIQAESELGERRIEIAAAAERKIVADAIAEFDKLKAARLEKQVAQEQEVTDLRLRYSDERFGRELAQLTRQGEQEKMRVRELQRDGLISFQQMQTRIGQINTNTIDHMKKAWVDSPIACGSRDSRTSDRVEFPGRVPFLDRLDPELRRGDEEHPRRRRRPDHCRACPHGRRGCRQVDCWRCHRPRAQGRREQREHSGGRVRAAASQASIPFAGPFLAAGAASSMLSLLEGMTGPLLASAAGGFDVPMGVNPITQIHSREMVLPEEIRRRHPRDGERRRFRRRRRISDRDPGARRPVVRGIPAAARSLGRDAPGDQKPFPRPETLTQCRTKSFRRRWRVSILPSAASRFSKRISRARKVGKSTARFRDGPTRATGTGSASLFSARTRFSSRARASSSDCSGISPGISERMTRSCSRTRPTQA